MTRAGAYIGRVGGIPAVALSNVKVRNEDIGHEVRVKQG